MPSHPVAVAWASLPLWSYPLILIGLLLLAPLLSWVLELVRSWNE